MKAIMLAAGVGRRLYGDNDDQPPKALLRFEGKTLLHRNIEILKANGVEELIMVVGYRKDELAAEVDQAGAADFVRTVFNPRFREGPMISLWTARAEMSAGSAMLFMDGDVLYHPVMMERLINARHANCFVMDRETETGEDPVRVCINDGAVVDFGKMIEGDFDLVGDWPGFMTMSPDAAAKIAAMTQVYLDAGKDDVTYESAMRDVLIGEPHGAFGYEDITGIPWVEIDFPRDLINAERTVLPRIKAMGDGRAFISDAVAVAGRGGAS